MKNIKVLSLLLLLSTVHFLTEAAEIIQITASTRHLVPRGKATDAIDGDWIMKNDKVIAVIAKAVFGREVNMRTQNVQGAVIDFTSLAVNDDYLAAFYPQGIPAPDTRKNPALFADKIEILKAKGSEIILRATRNPSDSVRYRSVTEYTLKDGESFLRVKTTYTNTSQQPVSLTVADKLRMDMDIETVSPIGKTNLAFMYNKWFSSAYAIYSADGLLITEKPKLITDPATGLLVGFQKAGKVIVTLEPGQSVEKNRYLMYGKDAAAIQKQVMAFENTGTAITTLKVTDTNKKPVPGAYIDIFNSKSEIASFAITNAAGIAEVPLIAGEYKFQAGKIGHDTINAGFTALNKPSVVPITMIPLTSVNFTVKEAGTGRMLPVKIEFKGINGSSDPFLGTTKRAEGTANLYYSVKSSFNIPVPPGDYMVTVSHGPEYETVKKHIVIKTGETKAVNAEIKRMFSSPQWVIADLHNHSARSGDNDADTRSRVINLAASGMEFAPATEHNRISSYTGLIKTMGLQKYIASAAGIELTGPTGVATGPNHQNAWPLTIQEDKQGGGFPGISADVYTQLKGIYDYDPGKTKFITHNHPGMEMPLLFFDKDRDGVIDNGLNTRKFTDAIELQTFVYDILNVTADDAKNKKVPVFYWLQMFNQGDRIFATMTSDSHMIGERGGLRFVYAYSKKDDPLTIDAYEVAANAKKGNIVMSNGPFLKADINGSVPGSDIKKGTSGLRMNIEVYANNEIAIDRIQVIVNGRQDKSLNFTAATHPKLFTSGALQFKNSFPLNLAADANVIVVATGKKTSPAPVQGGGRGAAAQFPIAVTNPFFVDVNGDGFVPNKDTLGEPLPVSVRAPGTGRTGGDE